MGLSHGPQPFRPQGDQSPLRRLEVGCFAGCQLAVVGVVLPQVCWIDALAVPWESPTTGAGLSDLSGADKTSMTFFGLSFTVISRSPGCCAEPVIARTAGCGVGHSSIRAADQPLKQKKDPWNPTSRGPVPLHDSTASASCRWLLAGSRRTALLGSVETTHPRKPPVSDSPSDGPG